MPGRNDPKRRFVYRRSDCHQDGRRWFQHDAGLSAVFEPVGIAPDVHHMEMMQQSIEHGGDIIILTVYYKGSIFMLLTGFLVLYCLSPIANYFARNKFLIPSSLLTLLCYSRPNHFPYCMIKARISSKVICPLPMETFRCLA